MRQLNIYSAREVCPEALPSSQPAHAGSALLPPPPSLLVQRKFSPAMACSPQFPQPWRSRLSRGLLRTEGRGKGPGPGVMPWSLHSCQTSSPGLSEERQLSKWLSFGGRGAWRLAKMELLSWGGDPGLQRATYLSACY